MRRDYAESRRAVRVAAWLGVVVALGWVGAARAAEQPAATNRPAPAAAGTNRPAGTAAKTDYGTPAEKEKCTQNLKRIYDAIQAYREDQKDLPNWLSDLVPKYLDDMNVLTCPVSQRTGRIDEAGLRDPNLAISYAYQFGNQPIPESFSGGSKRTMREWKRRQMGVVGDIVPLVRCRHHLPQLNLSFGGKVFESPPGWESMMTNGFKPADVSIRTLFPEDALPAPAGTAASPASDPGKSSTAGAQASPADAGPAIVRIPSRDPQAPAALIDLTDYYNAGLDEPWHGRPGSGFKHSDLAWLPKGIQRYAGVEFDVRGVVQLSGRNLGGPRFPASVKGIRVSRKCNALHFLHATGWSVPEGVRIGHVRVVYADGEEREMPIVYGREVLDWTAPAKPEACLTNNGPVIAWSGKSPRTQAQGTTLRVFKSTWTNPLPETRIDTLDYVSARTNCAPFLIAITAD